MVGVQGFNPYSPLLVSDEGFELSVSWSQTRRDNQITLIRVCYLYGAPQETRTPTPFDTRT